MDVAYRNALLAESGLELVKQRLLQLVPVQTPAAGALWSIRIPGGDIWEILSIHQTLTASAVVANRVLTVIVTDSDGNRRFRWAGSATITAGNTIEISLDQGLGYNSGSAAFQGGLPSPPIPLYGGYTIGVLVANIDAGDQLSGISLLTRQWSVTDVAQSCEDVARGMQRYFSTNTESQPKG